MLYDWFPVSVKQQIKLKASNYIVTVLLCGPYYTHTNLF